MSRLRYNRAPASLLIAIKLISDKGAAAHALAPGWSRRKSRSWWKCRYGGCHDDYAVTDTLFDTLAHEFVERAKFDRWKLMRSKFQRTLLLLLFHQPSIQYHLEWFGSYCHG